MAVVDSWPWQPTPGHARSRRSSPSPSGVTWTGHGAPLRASLAPSLPGRERLQAAGDGISHWAGRRRQRRAASGEVQHQWQPCNHRDNKGQAPKCFPGLHGFSLQGSGFHDAAGRRLGTSGAATGPFLCRQWLNKRDRVR
jgi:hypothetical protein